MHLTLLVPELIWPEPGDRQTLADLPASGFSWLDGRARFARQPAQPFEDVLAGAFGHPAQGYASLRLFGESPTTFQGESHWLCADPVHLRFHHERIVLADAGAFELSDDEADALLGALNAQFAELGHFQRGSARRWYLRLAQPVEHHAAPLSAVAGRRMDGELNGTPSPLRRWANEIQMFLHGHPVNAARAARGAPAINGLWLWGAGRTGTLTNPPGVLWSDDPLAQGLARRGACHVAGRPTTLAAALARDEDSALVLIDSLLPGVLYENPEQWRQAWQALEADWLLPGRAALGRGIERLDIIAPTIFGVLHWRLVATARWCFWKNGRTPAVLAQQLAEGPHP